MDNDILNLEQAMELFGVSERTMIKLLREERIPARKIGREWRFSKSALLNWLGTGVSTDYLNQMDLFRVVTDRSASVPEILSQIGEAVDILKDNGTNIRGILPELEEDIFLPTDATLRVSYKRQREVEKLTLKVFWPIRN